jgi:hypothetical protein
MGRHAKPKPSPSPRDIIRAAAQRTSGRKAGRDFAAEHREHLDAALAACLGQINVDHPGWRLEYVRSDWGGPIYAIRVGGE